MYICRLTSVQDKQWFDNCILQMVEDKLGANYKVMAEPSPAFVDFMRYITVKCLPKWTCLNSVENVFKTFRQLFPNKHFPTRFVKIAKLKVEKFFGFCPKNALFIRYYYL